MTAPITRVALYCRVSTEDQATAGTIETQTTWLHHYCDLYGHRIAGEYADDGVSGTIPLGQRPAGRRLLSDAKNGAFDVVLCYRVDRLSRARLFYLLEAVEALEALGVGFISATEPFDTRTAMGRMILALLGSFAEMDRESILERTKQGRARAARNGRYPGGRVPYGYRLKERVFVVEEDEAATVRRIFRLYGEGMGLWQIATLLNADGIAPGPRSREWDHTRIHRLLRNPAYLGRYQFGAATMDCPAIITPDAVAAAEQTRERHQRLAGRNTRRRTYLLKGLLRCAVCGSTYIGSVKHGRGYYSCGGRHFGGACTVRGWLRADDAEADVWEDIVAFVRDPGKLTTQLLADLHRESTDAVTIEAELTLLEAPLRRIEQERQTVITLYRRGRITDAELDGQLDSLELERLTLQTQRDALTGRALTLRERETRILTIEALLRSLAARVDVADALEQQEIIYDLVARVIVEDKHLRIVYRWSE